MFIVEVIGNIGADAKVINNNGKEFVSFNVASTEKRNGVDYATWISCTTNAVKLAPFLKKGTKVYIRGNGGIHTFKNDKGEFLANVSVFVKDIEFCGGGSKNESTKTDNTSNKEEESKQESTSSDKESDEDMPF